ncbi:MAG: hypothetical protein PSV17_04205 [Methylotenera sp.]|uniref:hypothetical protein n=1 Tax=Methylotenera sp. TaxID=2051956 RepID=UPI002487F417|nr:hypothetical protein [Methylotenera sp.]MDI1308622.1 hypothetical protein [Methylotenera sp.]
MIRKPVIAMLYLYSSLVIASTEQIEVIGLTPSLTTLAEYKAIALSNKGTSALMEIGGYKLICSAKFRNDTLDEFSCPLNSDLTKDSNLVIFDTLSKGFTEKFGPPTFTVEAPIRNRLGVEYKSSQISWTDTLGNILTIQSIAGRIDSGMLLMLSSEKMKEATALKSEKDSNRKF